MSYVMCHVSDVTIFSLFFLLLFNKVLEIFVGGSVIKMGPTPSSFSRSPSVCLLYEPKVGTLALG